MITIWHKISNSFPIFISKHEENTDNTNNLTLTWANVEMQI